MTDGLRVLGLMAKLFGALLFMFIAALRAGPSFDTWLIISLAGISGMFWHSAICSLEALAAVQRGAK